MVIDFGIVRRAARRERARTFNPEEAPPHGDFPYLDLRSLQDLDRDANHPWVTLILAVIAALIGVMFVCAMVALYPLRHAPHRIGQRALIVLVRDDGRYANNPLHAWFDSLASGRGACCSNADGITVEDVDYDTNCAKTDCHYRVRLLGEWHDVDDEALVTVPNKFGRAVVWPVFQDDEDGHHVGVTYTRCFMPGAGA